MTEFLTPATPEVLELFADTATEMVLLFGISRAEAVARINAKWEGRQFLRPNELILHQDGRYWAQFIYCGGHVPDWSATADRSAWIPVPRPPLDSPNWTLGPPPDPSHIRDT
ncbi:hypothetical protein ACWCPQ_08670 [Nocardia sp. NPDC001965]